MYIDKTITDFNRKTNEMEFQNLTVFEKQDKRISDVSGLVKEGEVLGIVGHQATKKTILLETLAGRHPMCVGDFYFNKTPLKYQEIPHHAAFVTSHPVFLPTLTVRETLQFAAELRLQSHMTTDGKKQFVHDVEQLTKLHDVAANPVMFCSTFVQKCLAIACELMKDTPVIVIDDPFNGIAYGDIIKMMTVISSMCQNLQKAVVISIATPTSHVFNRCSSTIILHNGQVVYSGCPERLAEFLSSVGHVCPSTSSPIEMTMDLLFDLDETSAEKRHFWRASKTTGSNGRWDKVWTKSNGWTMDVHKSIGDDIRETALIGDASDYQLESVTVEENGLLERSANGGVITSKYDERQRRQSPSYMKQLQILTARNFHTARRRILFPVSVLQNVYISVICALIWWRLERTEETVKDRMGLFFFTVVQWAFLALLDAILTFPKELRVIQQERKRQLYTPSAYCLAKTLSETPLTILQPCAFMCVIYWVANLNNVTAFLASLGVLILDVLAAQGIGLFLGVALNPPWTVSIMSLGLLSMMLWGGAFCTPPLWMSWGKYASYFTYGLNAFISLEFTNAEPIRCGRNSIVPLCYAPSNGTVNDTITHFPSEVVLAFQEFTWSVTDDVMVLLGIAITSRLLWYFLLRHKT